MLICRMFLLEAMRSGGSNPQMLCTRKCPGDFLFIPEVLWLFVSSKL